jgi:hypothetical protein
MFFCQILWHVNTLLFDLSAVIKVDALFSFFTVTLLPVLSWRGMASL